MNTPRAGKRSRPHTIGSDKILGVQNCVDSKAKCPTPRSFAFKIDSIAPFSEIQTAKPFKFISFDGTPKSRHKRQPSVIIKDVEQVYSFTKDESFSSNEIIEEESISGPKNFQKNSIFASTTEPKSSAYNSIVKKSYLEEEHPKYDNSDLLENYDIMTKPDENYTNLVFTSNEESYQSPLGFLPSKLFCEKCKMNMSTVVSVKMPTLPFWKVLCCTGVAADVCTDLEDLNRYQEFEHRCRKCNLVIASVQPI
jgi:hypothetical protein